MHLFRVLKSQLNHWTVQFMPWYYAEHSFSHNLISLGRIQPCSIQMQLICTRNAVIVSNYVITQSPHPWPVWHENSIHNFSHDQQWELNSRPFDREFTTLFTLQHVPIFSFHDQVVGVIDSRSKGLGFISFWWSRVEVSGRLNPSHLCPPSSIENTVEWKLPNKARWILPRGRWDKARASSRNS